MLTCPSGAVTSSTGTVGAGRVAAIEPSEARSQYNHHQMARYRHAAACSHFFSVHALVRRYMKVSAYAGQVCRTECGFCVQHL